MTSPISGCPADSSRAMGPDTRGRPADVPDTGFSGGLQSPPALRPSLVEQNKFDVKSVAWRATDAVASDAHSRLAYAVLCTQRPPRECAADKKSVGSVSANVTF